MAFDYKRDRIIQSIKELKKEISSIDYDIAQAKAEEAYEIEKVHDNYHQTIKNKETRIADIRRTIQRKEEELGRYDELKTKIGHGSANEARRARGEEPRVIK